jgi:hypothetical protein
MKKIVYVGGSPEIYIDGVGRFKNGVSTEVEDDVADILVTREYFKLADVDVIENKKSKQTIIKEEVV